MDAILIQAALEINYSSIYPYFLFKKKIRSQENPLVEDDVLAEGSCYPNMDCVGSTYFIRHKILTIFATFDEESAYAFANDSYLETGKSNENFMSLLSR